MAKKLQEVDVVLVGLGWTGGILAKELTAAGLKGADLLWDVTGPTNVWNEPGATTAVPVLDERWPAFMRRVAFQVLNRAKRR